MKIMLVMLDWVAAALCVFGALALLRYFGVSDISIIQGFLIAALFNSFQTEHEIYRLKQ